MDFYGIQNTLDMQSKALADASDCVNSGKSLLSLAGYLLGNVERDPLVFTGGTQDDLIDAFLILGNISESIVNFYELYHEPLIKVEDKILEQIEENSQAVEDKKSAVRDIRSNMAKLNETREILQQENQTLLDEENEWEQKQKEFEALQQRIAHLAKIKQKLTPEFMAQMHAESQKLDKDTIDVRNDWQKLDGEIQKKRKALAKAIDDVKAAEKLNTSLTVKLEAETAEFERLREENADTNKAIEKVRKDVIAVNDEKQELEVYREEVDKIQKGIKEDGFLSYDEYASSLTDLKDKCSDLIGKIDKAIGKVIRDGEELFRNIKGRQNRK